MIYKLRKVVRSRSRMECIVCSKSSEMLCQRCRTPYCSRNCQGIDWPTHKSICIPMPLLVAAPNKLDFDKFKAQNVLSNSLRPLRKETKLPTKSEISSLAKNQKLSLFDNPFKSNSKNIGFKMNETKNVTSSVCSLINEKMKSEIIAEQGSGGLMPLNGGIARLNTEITNMPLNKVETSSIVLEDICPVDKAKETETTEISSKLLPRMLSQHNNVKRSIELEELTEVKNTIKEEVEPRNLDHAILTMNDVEIVPLPSGKKLFCIDSSNIGKGWISACINDTRAIELIDRLGDKITDFSRGTNDHYRPAVDELCLCKFDDDKQWYRAVVSDVVGEDSFEIIFIDYGNVSTVPSRSIRKMPQEFTHHCLVNKCYIKGFPDVPTEADIAKYAELFDANFTFEPSSLEVKASGVYVISLKE